MKDLFYKPILEEERKYDSDGQFIGPERDYYSESPPDEEELAESIPESDDISIDDIVEEIEEVASKIPDIIKKPFEDILTKIVDDLEDLKIIENEPVDILPEVEEDDTSTDDSGVINVIPKDLQVGETEIIKLFPSDNGIDIELEKNPPVAQYAKENFIKDKKDMYNHFVEKLKLMIQQHMREILYISIKGGFSSYRDLYLDFDLPSNSISGQYMHIADRITKSQIERDQKNRLLRKMFTIEQTIAHLVSNKATYEQRNRYYGIDYMDTEDYLSSKENDELRKMRKDYDKKYEQSMYNYYKYLNSSLKLAEDVLQLFVSEARGKSILKQKGFDPNKGAKDLEAKKATIEKEYKQETEKRNEEAKKTLEERVSNAEGAGKAKNYGGSGTFSPPMPGGAMAQGASGAGSTTAEGSGNLPIDISPNATAKVNEIRSNKDMKIGDKISQVAILCNELRGASAGGNKIYYDQAGYNAKTHILSKACYKSDCSSFSKGVVLYAIGVDIGYSTKGQVEKNKGKTWIYDMSKAEPGDLIYQKYVSGSGYKGYSISMPNGTRLNVNHVMVYIGNNEVIHCTKYGKVSGLERKKLNANDERKFAGILRL